MILKEFYFGDKKLIIKSIVKSEKLSKFFKLNCHFSFLVDFENEIKDTQTPVLILSPYKDYFNHSLVISDLFNEYLFEFEFEQDVMEETTLKDIYKFLNKKMVNFTPDLRDEITDSNTFLFWKDKLSYLNDKNKNYLHLGSVYEGKTVCDLNTDKYEILGDVFKGFLEDIEFPNNLEHLKDFHVSMIEENIIERKINFCPHCQKYINKIIYKDIIPQDLL